MFPTNMLKDESEVGTPEVTVESPRRHFTHLALRQLGESHHSVASEPQSRPEFVNDNIPWSTVMSSASACRRVGSLSAAAKVTSPPNVLCALVCRLHLTPVAL
mmetsp:Transcript_9524/g.26688  ORF Transcript_9524/g.26688 Transcript_9524/m.26688 type:complete len:103 (-) Transcript_9524:535-843(-)